MVSRPVWNIPLRQVCPPYLHILLGIVKKHHEMLESACHDLDLKIAEDLAQTSDQIDETIKYGSFVATLRKKIKLEKKNPEERASTAWNAGLHKSRENEARDSEEKAEETADYTATLSLWSNYIQSGKYSPNKQNLSTDLPRQIIHWQSL